MSSWWGPPSGELRNWLVARALGRDAAGACLLSALLAAVCLLLCCSFFASPATLPPLPRSCEGSPWQGNAAGEWRINPHVQSYVLATDKVRGNGQ